MSDQRIYMAIIEQIFKSKYRKGMESVMFEREDITKAGSKINVSVPKNLGDLVYSFRYRTELPPSIQRTAVKGKHWIIRPAGKAIYRFEQVAKQTLTPNENLVATKIPDSTPGIVVRYAFNDEQALLAKLRYNRLIDVFTGVTCYSLQNHLRTTVQGMGQVETDEIYVGVDKKGIQYVLPVQAKGGKDKLSIVQIEQDFGVCSTKFPMLVCRPIATQFMAGGVIAMFEFEQDGGTTGICAEKHYKLVPSDQITDSDLKLYKERLGE